MSGRVCADDTVRVKGSNPSWLDREREKRDGKAAAEVSTKVSRHRAGVIPDWAVGDGDDDDVCDDDVAMPAHGGKRRVAAPAVIVSRGSDDPSGQKRVVKPPSLVKGGAAGTHDADASASESEEDEDDIARRRAMARARLAARNAEPEEDALPVTNEDEEPSRPILKKDNDDGDVSGSSSWETDTDASDSEDGRKLLKPVFVSKQQRETLQERDRLDAEADDEWARREVHKKKRAEESKQLAELEVELENQIANAEENREQSDVDTDDELEDPAVAYAAWRIRELLRIKEDEETREKMFEERELQEKIRRMSEAEKKAYFDANPEMKRVVDNAEGGNPKDAKNPNDKPGFMQKYYHKGAFFQEASDDAFGTASTHDIYKRDFSAPTGGDKGVDKKNLPRSMQVRGDKFGKMGQTKWTHLAAEDTSRLGGNKEKQMRPRHKEKELSFEKPKR